MLKQSLIQEKLSDLTTGSGSTAGSNGALVKLNDAKAELIGSSHMHNMPQWPRVQIDKHITSSLKRNAKLLINTVTSTSPTSVNKTMLSISAKTSRKSNENLDLSFNDNDKEFEGNEMVNYYTNYGRFGNDLQQKSLNTNENNNNTGHFNLHTNEIYNIKNLNDQRSVKSSGVVGERVVSDSSIKLKYLEKSIRFIQQQHVETLNGLHQEIDKLKNENRGKLIVIL